MVFLKFRFTIFDLRALKTWRMSLRSKAISHHPAILRLPCSPLESTAPIQYMELGVMGTISLRYRGVYTGTYPYISYDSIGTAQYDVQPLAFSGFASETGPGRGRFWYFNTGSSQMIADSSSSLFGVVG